jgi:hypothetical protein
VFLPEIQSKIILPAAAVVSKPGGAVRPCGGGKQAGRRRSGRAAAVSAAAVSGQPLGSDGTGPAGSVAAPGLASGWLAAACGHGLGPVENPVIRVDIIAKIS